MVGKVESVNLPLILEVGDWCIFPEEGVIHLIKSLSTCLARQLKDMCNVTAESDAWNVQNLKDFNIHNFSIKHITTIILL